jgi:asparagine synthase (glutamine-hydrolysing)
MCSIFGLTGSRFPRDLIKTCFDRTISRGPDMSRMVDIPGGVLGFHRLAIMGLHEEGMQPFRLEDDYVVCNGELYGFRPLRARLMETYDLKSECDCEILLPLYREYGVEMFKTLDAEFALILYDGRQGKLIAARDPIGIRPLYYGQTVDGGIAFASEPKNLIGMCEKILPFPPGHYWMDGQFIQYADPAYVGYFTMKTEEEVCEKLRRLLMDGVKSAWTPTRPSASCFPAAWIPPWSAPSPGKRSESRSAPSPSAWTWTQST